ncbi:peptide-methionine (S)-S-oxide reductase MsrA [Chromohalobacter canadensis]|uniref:Peptide methionine sulfoxide reductase MsrA n=1 Tax=Chromohalobacter canadensis TaxID=141389 RepID=A0A285VTC8_9GAMM|nr:peptide-methionine (S)-S-oxide reductase MsrA [Chromohalobacter canadensis]MCK0768619.1 peptide-methionine (S)-S-oxide reductase MsrA [Chromohalobacter canadensis]MCT8469693.1 peptide-methionine (S)-S-oxide reductase MsrA [Chromohalobacter canadensis]MCT8472472.1 peptide-methionine (S)-S-oxide reductase MsrA [Chromohalobacter canadensis]MCT8499415.1 peptide-methionine (S)-S-oxide reductase MsrA [Chromohalobacter canadensis]WQH09124.1 peptide-methionine (S)-S-oxide reductase MsrA [Chromohalo
MWPQESLELPTPETALKGRDTPIRISGTHYVNGRSMLSPFPEGHEEIVLGLGCFWGAERLFWEMPGVYVTAVGYAGGYTPNPTYEETCTGHTGHAEVVHVVFDPTEIGLPELLRAFWEAHDPTQGMQQGNDIGSQYRSVIYTTDELHRPLVDKSWQEYDQALRQQGLGHVTTEVAPLEAFYYAEEYHQQYLAKNPAGYCGLKGTGVACPVT